MYGHTGVQETQVVLGIRVRGSSTVRAAVQNQTPPTTDISTLDYFMNSLMSFTMIWEGELQTKYFFISSEFKIKC